MKKILVTGAGGYIGRHVVQALIDMGYCVYASDIVADNIRPPAIFIDEPIFSGDADIYEKLGEPDYCIHLAWKDGFIHNSSVHMERLSDHFIFIKNMLFGGLKHIAVMGSMHEIGYWEGAIDENTPANPSSLYGIAKNSLRLASKILTEQTQTKLYWLRGYYVMGEDENNNSIFSKITQWEKDGRKSFPFTSGKNKYDFITVKELAKQIAIASVQEEFVGEINCCSGIPIPLSKKVNDYIAERGYKIRPEYNAFPDRAYDSPEVWGDSTIINSIKNKYKLLGNCGE